MGPGLGRHPAVAQMALRLIRKAASKNIPLGMLLTADSSLQLYFIVDCFNCFVF